MPTTKIPLALGLRLAINLMRLAAGCIAIHQDGRGGSKPIHAVGSSAVTGTQGDQAEGQSRLMREQVFPDQPISAGTEPLGTGAACSRNAHRRVGWRRQGPRLILRSPAGTVLLRHFDQA